MRDSARDQTMCSAESSGKVFERNINITKLCHWVLVYHHPVDGYNRERLKGDPLARCNPQPVQRIELVQLAGYPARFEGGKHGCTVSRFPNQQ